MNIVVVGHVDHGKSTLIGRLLYDSEQVAESKVQELQKVAEEYKKKFEFSSFMDAFDDEIKEDRTIDTTKIMFKTQKRLYTITDVPGHKEFLKNMLTGASFADVGILVVAQDEGIQEQTRRHAFILDLLGIQELIVFVNKMDLVDYDQKIYEDLKLEINQMLVPYFFRTRFLFGSAYEGIGVFKESQGESIVGILDSIDEKNPTEKETYIQVQGTYKDRLFCKVISGRIKENDILRFYPLGNACRVEGLESIGNCVSFRETNIPRGNIGTLSLDRRMLDTALVEVFLVEGSLDIGDEVYLGIGSSKIKASVKDISLKIDTESGKTYPKGRIGSNEAGLLLITKEPSVTLPFKESHELGRFTVDKEGRNTGVGVIL